MNQSGRAFQNLDPFVLEFSISSKLAFFYLFIFFLPRTKMVRVEIGVLNRRYLHVRYRRLNSPNVPVPAIFLRSSLRIASKVNQSGWAGLSHEQRRDRRKKIARCVRINRWRKSLAIFAGDHIRCDRRIKCQVCRQFKAYCILRRMTVSYSLLRRLKISTRPKNVLK